MSRPVLYVSNWSSWRTPGRHGPGRKWCIMALPRPWEHGDGTLRALTPSALDVRGAYAGTLSLDAYRDRYLHTVMRTHAACSTLGPSYLRPTWKPGDNAPVRGDAGPFVADGDTLCCKCAVDDARAGRCHRAWAAPLLVEAGWDVVLDGVLLDRAEARARWNASFDRAFGLAPTPAPEN